ncbi:unnamed protein product [Schistosoma rodhaini]|uniref:BTB domain-containing protein n=1 Tax=Schistosoma rodhaini TaxID=6188 RepID=A0AA85FNT5_9TREM|nr:unnamed protein product [Schistosoma rodhaini]
MSGTSAGVKSKSYLPNSLNFQDREIYKIGFTALDCMRRDGKLCDVTLIADNNRFTAHKIVLAATIPFFNGMFLSNMAESTKSEVTIHGLDACALEAFIGYAYTGLVQINPRNVQSILIGANFLQLNNVRNICCRYISERLTVDIVLPMRNLAQSFLCTELVSACETYIYKNFEDIARTVSFFNLEGCELMELLESDELNVSSEERLFDIIMSWVEFETKPNPDTETNSVISDSVNVIELPENYDGNFHSIKPSVSSEIGYQNSCCNGSLHSTHYSHSSHCSTQIFSSKPRTDFLPCLLRRIRLPLIPVNYIFSVISRHDLIRKDIRCRDILDEVRDVLLMSWKTSEFFNCRPRRCQDIFGVIYAVGGWNADLECHGIVEIYHPSLGRWELSESMISKRSRIGVVALKGLLYAIGGFDGNSRLRTTEVYNPKTGKWATVASMICRRSAAGAAAYDGCLYVCGGFDGQTSLRTCEMYIPEQDTWKLISSLNEPRSAGGLVALNGRLYAIGGHNGLAVFSTVECYEKGGDLRRTLPSSRFENDHQNNGIRQNPTNVWYSVASMLHRRCRHGSTAFRDRIIVAGGYDGASFLQSVEMFDPTTGPDRNGLHGQWTEISSLSVPRSRVGLAVTAGCLYAIGGYDGSAHLRTVECFKSPIKQNPYALSSNVLQSKCNTLSNLLNKPNISDNYNNHVDGDDDDNNDDGISCNHHPCSMNSDFESISSCNSSEAVTFVGTTQNRKTMTLENSKPKLISHKPSIPSASVKVNCNGGTSTLSSVISSSSNPFADWKWSSGPSLIAHEGWVGICVLPFGQSSSVH